MTAFTNPDPSSEQMQRHLRRANEVARRAMALGRHPFGALLVAPDHETVLAEQGNVDSVNHAEAVLARTAVLNFAPDYLWNCTLVTTVEPCCMCAGTQYWAQHRATRLRPGGAPPAATHRQPRGESDDGLAVP